MADPGATATSQGPIRHPRPLTAAELHLELEQEQESIVRSHSQIYQSVTTRRANNHDR